MPGSVIGNGCIVAAFSFVSGEFEDFKLVKPGQSDQRIAGKVIRLSFSVTRSLMISIT
jgi:hypothetical protein